MIELNATVCGTTVSGRVEQEDTARRPVGRTRRARLAGACLLLLVVLFAAAGCSVTQSVPSNPRPEYIHTVTSRGETLGSIAEWYTGSAGNWTKIARANPRIKPRSLKLGQTILIPRTLVRTEQPMPGDSIRTRLRIPEKVLAENASRTVVKKASDSTTATALQAGPPGNADSDPGSSPPQPERIVFTQSTDLRAIAPAIGRTSANGEPDANSSSIPSFSCHGTECERTSAPPEH